MTDQLNDADAIEDSPVTHPWTRPNAPLPKNVNLTNLTTPRALFSPTYLLNLVKQEVAPFDPPTPKNGVQKPHRRTKREVDWMTLAEICHLKFSTMRALRGRSVGRQHILLTLISYTPLRYVRNVAREE